MIERRFWNIVSLILLTCLLLSVPVLMLNSYEESESLCFSSVLVWKSLEVSLETQI